MSSEVAATKPERFRAGPGFQTSREYQLSVLLRDLSTSLEMTFVFIKPGE